MAVFYFSFGITIGLLFVLRQYVQFKWGKCKSQNNMRGKTVIITGANSGLGKRTALELAKRGAKVILACRNVASGKETADEIHRQASSNGSNCLLLVKHLDLGSLASIRHFAADVTESEDRLDVLVNNAAVGWCPFTLTEDGFELQFGVNHLGHFLLTNLLLDVLKRTPKSRIVIVSSSLYKKGNVAQIVDLSNVSCSKMYEPGKAYANSKLANVFFGQELSRRLEGTGVEVFTLSPGLVWTNLGRHHKLSLLEKLALSLLAIVLVRTPFQGCQTILYCVLDDEVIGQSGGFFQNCARSFLKDEVRDPTKGKLLWDLSVKLTKLQEK